MSRGSSGNASIRRVHPQRTAHRAAKRQGRAHLCGRPVRGLSARHLDRLTGGRQRRRGGDLRPLQHLPCRNVPGAPQGAGNLGAIGAKTRDPEGPRLTLHVFSPRRAQDGGRGQLPEPCLPAAAGWHGPVRLPTAGGAARNTGGIGPPLPAPERSRPRGANVPSNASPAGGAAQATWTALCICSVLQSTCRTRHCWRGPGPSGLLPCAGSGWAAGPCPPPRLTRLDTQEYPPDDSAGQDEASLRPGRGGGRRGHQQQGVPALHPGGAHGRTQLSRPLQRPTLTWLAGGARGLRLGVDEGASQVR